MYEPKNTSKSLIHTDLANPSNHKRKITYIVIYALFISIVAITVSIWVRTRDNDVEIEENSKETLVNNYINNTYDFSLNIPDNFSKSEINKYEISLDSFNYLINSKLILELKNDNETIKFFTDENAENLSLSEYVSKALEVKFSSQCEPSQNCDTAGFTRIEESINGVTTIKITVPGTDFKNYFIKIPNSSVILQIGSNTMIIDEILPSLKFISP